MATINLSKKNYKSNNDNGKRALRSKYYHDARWKVLRKAKIMANPICEICIKNDEVTPMEDVHHIISPFTEGYCNESLFFDYDNLMSLCKVHHSKIHANRGSI